MLRRNHVVQVEPKRLLKNMPLRLPILLRHRHELVVELPVDLRSEFLRSHFITLVIPNAVRDLQFARGNTISTPRIRGTGSLGPKHALSLLP